MNGLKKIAFLCYERNVKLCLSINKNSHRKAEKVIKFCCCSPFMLVRWLCVSIYENTVGMSKAIQRNREDASKKFQTELAIIAIAKNEAPYIREWIAYHLSVGVEKIYLYDNDSEDDLQTIVADYVDRGEVVYIAFSGKNKQMEAYNHAIQHYKDEVRYMAFIDCDEFLVAPKTNNLLHTVDSLMKKIPNAGGVGVNWALYGSSGYEKRQQGLITEIFLKRGQDNAWPNFHVKTICNPRLIKDYISPHFPIYQRGAWSVDSKGKRQRLWFNHDVDFSELRCNHYFCKSKEEFLLKRSRGMADRQEQYDFTKFDEYDLNDVYDDIMLKYAEKIKQRI